MPAPRRPASLADYVALARPDHWVKHIFIVPGVMLAWILLPQPAEGLAVAIGLGFVSAAAIASANYVLNETVDARFDAHHPTKSSRPAVATRLSIPVVVAEYLGLVVLGLGLAAAVSPLFLLTSAVFLVSGLVYNVRPLRTKERVYLDVVSESINNPIRLTLGWAMVDPSTLPPSSLLLAYWMGGAFLMAIKRFAEYRTLTADGKLRRAHVYRRSFRRYTEETLLVSSFVYGLLAAFFLAVFLIKYRVEYLLCLPLFAALFAAYLRMGLEPESAAQAPERLFRQKGLVALVVLLVAALALFTWIDVPVLERLTAPHYIRLSSP